MMTICQRRDLSELPVRVTRDRAAELVTHHYFEASARTLERWPLAWQRINGKAHCLTSELSACAEGMLASAPRVMSGQVEASAIRGRRQNAHRAGNHAQEQLQA